MSQMLESRVFLVFKGRPDGGVCITATKWLPSPMQGAMAVVRTRGQISAEPLVIDLGAKGQPGKDGTNGRDGKDGKDGAGWTALPDVVLEDKATVVLSLGGRRKRLPCAGAQVGDRLLVFPISEPPAGYVMGDAVCTEPGFIRVSFFGPALALLASNTIPLRVVALR